MPANYHRPGTSYVPISRPNDEQFQIYTREMKSPVPDKIYDQQFGRIFDIANELDIRIDGVQTGDLPGIGNAVNINKLLTLSALNVLSWTNITGVNILDASIPGIKLIPQAITQRELADGGILTSKIQQKAITTALLDDECVTSEKLEDEAVTRDKIASAAISSDEIEDGAIRATELASNAVTTSKILDDNVTFSKLAQDVLDRIIPIATVVEFAGTAGVPAMWLECNGQEVSRATYATLFTNIGVIYGAGNGATTFNLPDRRGRVAVGIASDNSTGGRITAATAASITTGGTFGDETVTLNVTQIPPHNHALTVTAASFSGGVGATTWSVTAPSGIFTENAGGGLPHSNTQPSMFTRYYIRAL